MMNKETCDLQKAASLLNCHPQTVLKYVHSGELKGRKIGRAWVFVIDDLVSLIRNGNNDTRLPMPGNRKETPWHCTKEVKHTGLTSQLQVENELDALLAPMTSKKRSSSLTK